MTGLDALCIDVKCVEEAQKTWAYNGVSNKKIATMVDILTTDFEGMVMV